MSVDSFMFYFGSYWRAAVKQEVRLKVLVLAEATVNTGDVMMDRQPGFIRTDGTCFVSERRRCRDVNFDLGSFLFRRFTPEQQENRSSLGSLTPPPPALPPSGRGSLSVLNFTHLRCSVVYNLARRSL